MGTGSLGVTRVLGKMLAGAILKRNTEGAYILYDADNNFIGAVQPVVMVACVKRGFLFGRASVHFGTVRYDLTARGTAYIKAHEAAQQFQHVSARPDEREARKEQLLEREGMQNE